MIPPIRINRLASQTMTPVDEPVTGRAGGGVETVAELALFEMLASAGLTRAVAVAVFMIVVLGPAVMVLAITIPTDSDAARPA